MEIAIGQSTGELIVTTDADCTVTGNWLQTIAAFYETHQPVFIAAPVSINCGINFIEMFQALDFAMLQGITGASVHKKIHSMCNGANLAYTKKAFEEVGGFAGIDHIASGDDMLLMHKIYKRYPDQVMFLKSKAAIVQTAPVNSIGEFFNQRIRWASKADKYDDKRIFAVLFLVYLFNLLLVVLPVIALFTNTTFTIRAYPFNIIITVFEGWIF
ncbi:MAG: glycosyltransferase [Chitinophagaceae bacterium]|nr:glycosyltransferase [Chitinophagaceae bacterium]